MIQALVSNGAGIEFLKSLLALEGRFLGTRSIPDWLESRRNEHRFTIHQIPFDELKSWEFDQTNGNLTHVSGRFFSIEGLEVRSSYPHDQLFYQPIINQPEIGILGILAKRFDGVLHFLLQAKMEPGNINLVQLSPTVQATKSNYTQAHGGSRPRYLEYFIERRHGRMLVDQLQSEQGSFFLRKRNRNMIVETDEDIPVHEDFCWLTLGQLKRMLQLSNLVNMDTRTVISSIPLALSETDIERAGLSGHQKEFGDFERKLIDSYLERGNGMHTNDDIISWFTELKAMEDVRAERRPLNDLPGWHRTPKAIEREDGNFFSVIAVAVEADNREVRGWCQPIVRPNSVGLTGFLTKRIRGILHFLVQARMEPGIFDMIEMAPTVQHLEGCSEQATPFLELFTQAPEGTLRYDCNQSEEGGRFFHFQNRNVVIELQEKEQIIVPRGYIWMTLGQIHEFLRFNNYFNIEARGLLACLGVGQQAT